MPLFKEIPIRPSHSVIPDRECHTGKNTERCGEGNLTEHFVQVV
jgi:hypothetical protein